MPSATHILVAPSVKRTEQLDVKTPILTYIRTTYSDAEADKAVDDLVGIQALRNEIVAAQTGNQGASKETLAKYYRALSAIDARIPVGGGPGAVPLTFSWWDAFKVKQKAAQQSLALEKAAVLFNLAATISQQALMLDARSPDGVKERCKMFQESAGVFSALRGGDAVRLEASRTADLAPECSELLEKMMLAQAQECVYHKAVMDNKSPGVVARLAKQAGVMYGEVAGLFGSQVLSGHFDESWVSHTRVKANVMEVMALMEHAKQLHSEDKVAHEIAVLSEAFTRLQAAKKTAKAISPEMAGSLKPIEDRIMLTLTRAHKDNNDIFLQRVPPFADVVAVQGACLVNPAPPTNLGAEERLFSYLVPDDSAKALAKYTSLVDATTREVAEKLAAAAEAEQAALRQSELPVLLQALDGHQPSSSVPPALVAELEDLHRMGGAAYLQGIMSEISDLRRNIEADLATCQKALDGDAAGDAAARAEFGGWWNLPETAALAKPLQDKIAEFRSTLAQAAASDASVVRRLADNGPAFAALTPEGAAARMPRLAAPRAPVGREDPAVVVASARRVLDALKTLAGERAAMEESLNQMRSKENVLPRLMATGAGAQDALLEEEGAKYRGAQEAAARLAARSGEVLAALERDAEAFKSAFQVAAWRSACDAAAGGIRSVVGTYREVLDHLSEGLRFYMSLQEAVKAHQLQCTDYEYTRALQRDELRDSLRQQAKQRGQQESDARAAAAMAAAAAVAAAAAAAAPPPPQPAPAPAVAGNYYPAYPGLMAATEGWERQQQQQKGGQEAPARDGAHAQAAQQAPKQERPPQQQQQQQQQPRQQQAGGQFLFNLMPYTPWGQ